ncbi:Uncharacterized protein SCF082_LOCUS30691, partial [Durusdinium trenchii]
AKCTVTGDPHVTDFYGDYFHTDPTATSAVLYSKNGFSVDGPITTVTDSSGSQFHLFYSLNFGSTTLKATTMCPNNQTKGTARVQLEHDFGSDGYVWIDVYCATSPTKSKLMGAFLNFDIYVVDFTNDASATFDTLEADSTGYCMGKDSGRRLRGVRALSSSSSPTCANVCKPSQACSATGDPHIKTFFKYDYSITNNQQETFVLYEMPGNTTYDEENDVSNFLVTITTNSTGRIHQVDFGEDRITTANCTDGVNTLPLGLRETFRNGDVLRIVVECTVGSNSNKPQPIFLNVVSLEKTDDSPDGTDTDFLTLETDQGNFGLCMEQSSTC